MINIRLLIALTGFAVIGCAADNYPFSASQNLTISQYVPYNAYSTAAIAMFSVNVQLSDGSAFQLGSALFRTYRYDKYLNFSIPVPDEVYYNGPSFESKSFKFDAVVDPCLTEVTHNFNVDFPEAWTNAQQGSISISRRILNRVKSITVGQTLELWGQACNLSPETECRNFYRLDVDKKAIKINQNATTVLLDFSHSLPLSTALKRVTFRQIGSRLCPMGLDSPTTSKDYSFVVDFSNSNELKRTILLRDLPPSVSFLIVAERTNQASEAVYMSVLDQTYHEQADKERLQLDGYWPYIASLGLSLLLLFSASAGVVLKHRALRRQNNHFVLRNNHIDNDRKMVDEELTPIMLS